MIARFQHVLVPLDFTERNTTALDVALEVAVQNQARVTLLHVIETIEFPGDVELQQFYARLEARATSALESAAGRFASARQQVECKVLYGKRAQEIARYAADEQVDLIVLSSHPIDPKEPWRGFNTVSYQVSVLCQCAVLLVK